MTEINGQRKSGGQCAGTPVRRYGGAAGRRYGRANTEQGKIMIMSKIHPSSGVRDYGGQVMSKKRVLH
jgi:hypothetical protein